MMNGDQHLFDIAPEISIYNYSFGYVKSKTY